MRRSLVSIALLSSALLYTEAALASDPCRSWKNEVAKTGGWVAQLTFHRVDVTLDGEAIHKKRDAKEIRKDERVRIGEIECEDNTVDVEVRSVEREAKAKVRLLLYEGERESKGAQVLDDLLAVVLTRPDR